MAQLNLLPWRDIRRAEQQKHYLYLLAGVVLAAALLVLLGNAIMQSLTDAQRERNQYLQTEIGKLDRQIAEIRQFKKDKTLLMQRIEVINRLQQRRHLPVQIMNELAQIMVPGVYLTRLDVQGQTMRLEGHSESNNYVADMMREVERAHWLAAPKLRQIVANDQNGALAEKHAFELELTILTEERQLKTESNTLIAKGDQG